MKSLEEKYKNIDKSTQELFNEKGTFKVLNLNNQTEDTQYLQYSLNNNYIQLFFCGNKNSTVAFNMEHCAIEIEAGQSNMVYFKDSEMKLLFKLSRNSELMVILISIEYFHSLFSIEGNFLFNFSSFKSGKPIMEPKEINPSVRLILNQLTTRQINESLRPIFIKGKLYELLSYYYSSESESEAENCPYIANEDTIIKIKKVKETIIDQMTNPPSLDELAKLVGLNIKKLKTDFKEFYGVPVFTFLLNYKMELAKKLLQEKKLNVNEISSQLGYSTASHFIAAFKRKYGITPKQYSIS